MSRGDNETALQELNLSIELEPGAWAYYHRAKIYREMGKDREATADCEAGLKLDPNHGELKWLRGELRKPADRRFQGRYAKPPTAAK
jgi:tetratricopeptide (TPR) repeat protein